MLRHLAGLLTGCALAPALWAALSWSAEHLPRLVEGDVAVATVGAAVLLVVAGAVCASLVATRLTPLIAGSCGLLLAGLCLWPAVAPGTVEPALGWIAQDSFLYPSGPGTAVALPLGVLLFGSALTPTRWRALDGLPDGARVVAATGREHYRPAPSEPAEPAEDRDPIGDTLTERPAPPPPRPEGDPNKTTTPFRRGGTGAVWTPLEDDAWLGAHGDERA